ncbi:shikimate dehydrogenase [Novosphingobium terrae]|uniref:shikimate dehydrogenase n=1 Tax=Novosphingobium terrae TaxID=2726189 RepID=UPI0019810E35|nr:shikimate dehydrogenase [Novosphingobium terrae]
MTDRYAVVGNPIDHSKSPLIHGMFAKAAGQDIVYDKILVPQGGFASVADDFRAAGGKGLNITAPCKLDAYAYADKTSPSAQLAGAVNALRFGVEGVEGENFDGVGLVRDITVNLQQAMTGRRVLMLGAGGAARGALLPFLEQQPAVLHIVNRTVGKAEELARIGASHGNVSAGGYDTVEAGAYDLVINATSASLTGDAPPISADAFGGATLAYELAYGKGLTPFLRIAREGAPQIAIADGVGMLAEQAAEAFAWWRGVRPDTAAVIAAITIPLS